ncbi:MAG: GGDEF domain-containing protein [Mycobacterium sp.]
MLGVGRRWWEQADQFHWFSVYLQDRSLDVQWRLTTFGFTALFAAVPMLMLASSYGPQSAPGRTVAVAASICGLAAGLLWLIHWPTRTQSLIYHAVCCLSIAAGCLTLSTSYGALMGTTMFAAIGGMLAYFHALVHVLANFTVALGCATTAAVRLFIDTGDIAVVVASLLLVLGLNIGIPFGIYALVHSLHTDLRQSDRDPLTGLPNRRSFYNSVHAFILEHDGEFDRLNVTMIDLDNFKNLADTRGHSVGDEALAGVGVVLRENCGPEGLLGRLGGEEFVIADVDTAAGHAVTAERIRQGIAAMPFAITASLGTCSATVNPGAGVEYPYFLDRLILVADTAMYRSKRAGGNRVQYRSLEDSTATLP